MNTDTIKEKERIVQDKAKANEATSPTSNRYVPGTEPQRADYGDPPQDEGSSDPPAVSSRGPFGSTGPSNMSEGAREQQKQDEAEITGADPTKQAKPDDDDDA